MTDREKANDLAQYYSEESDYKRTVGYDCAIAMAEWKDEQHAEEKQQWIEKACEWLKENIHDYYTTGDGGDEFEGWFDDMFEDFREAMKGSEE